MTDWQKDPMTAKEAADYGPQWGSMVTNGDPGAIMYSAIPPETAEYRDQMVAYIESALYPLAAEGDAGENEENEYEYNDSQMLRRMVAYLKGLDYPAPIDETVNGVDLGEFVEHYITAMLWASTDESGDDDSGGVPMDDNYTAADLAASAYLDIVNDCRAFLESAGQFVTAENFKGRDNSGHVANAGHDFFLTRCGHGAGFWDGDWESDDLPYGEQGPLTAAAKAAGEVWPYIGDDGKVYHS